MPTRPSLPTVVRNLASAAARLATDPTKIARVIDLSAWRSLSRSPPPEPSKQEQRRARFLSQWEHGRDVSRRPYASYDAYVEHQAAKLSFIENNLTEEFNERVALFKAHLAELTELLPAPRTVLCLGARLGHEVQAFHELGHFAVGIDLNPGPNNERVLKGDFHRLVFPDHSADCVYTNSLDHAFDLPRLLSEVRRVLRSGGHFVADLAPGYDEDFAAGTYESLHWARAPEFAGFLAATTSMTTARVTPLATTELPTGAVRAVLRKP